jgi:hypothetical protein
MDKKAVKEWAAEYKLINEMEREELRQRLLNETIEQSVRSYFAWNKLVLAFFPERLMNQRTTGITGRLLISLIEKWKNWRKGENV